MCDLNSYGDGKQGSVIANVSPNEGGAMDQDGVSTVSRQYR